MLYIPLPWFAWLLLKVQLVSVGLLPLLLYIPPPKRTTMLLAKAQSEIVGLLKVLFIPEPKKLFPFCMVNPLRREAPVKEAVFKHRPPGPPLAVEGSMMLCPTPAPWRIRS